MWKTVFKIVRLCLVERTFSPLAVLLAEQVLVITLRSVMYLIKNIHFYLSKVFSQVPLGEHLSRVGARQHNYLANQLSGSCMV